MKHPTSGIHPLRLFWRSWWLPPVSVILFVLTLSMGVLAKRYGSPGADLNVDVSLIHDRSPALTTLATIINDALSPAGNVVILALSCLILMFGLRRPLTALAFGSTVTVGWLPSEIGKMTWISWSCGDHQCMLNAPARSGGPAGRSENGVSGILRTRETSLVTGLLRQPSAPQWWVRQGQERAQLNPDNFSIPLASSATLHKDRRRHDAWSDSIDDGR
ncbi:hypothetical protein [Pseudarthrobacter sp. S9]|uniref:hypothetical protein n=1 Tax=Pseudarthrobacter sp. S9 TaxID=3418421 RepID=UPI003D051683